ncbi:hypothetical protein BpHYR1_003859 [Brachionus plicatilis]|uniref:Uncharacterized protein n=1 Tax=Brachionus plicatilis TaxID=10195 RepID=A0A3M7P9U0_BRAPC|nr:hypothetical protein BpHYR1_003859 [Brachionus plicatilis]
MVIWSKVVMDAISDVNSNKLNRNQAVNGIPRQTLVKWVKCVGVKFLGNYKQFRGNLVNPFDPHIINHGAKGIT